MFALIFLAYRIFNYAYACNYRQFIVTFLFVKQVPVKTCIRDPDSDCNLDCENKNPNPEVFTYYGNYCPCGIGNETLVCSCACFMNSDYHETNEI